MENDPKYIKVDVAKLKKQSSQGNKSTNKTNISKNMVGSALDHMIGSEHFSLNKKIRKD